jgi:hypothetical protein
MDAETLIRLWRQRQEEILSELPQPLRQEYRELAAAVRRAEETIAHHSDRQQEMFEDEPAPEGEEPSQRIPLTRRERTLRRYLATHGPATRVEILSRTGIPPGSLTVLLTKGKDDGWLEHTEDGKWSLKETEKKRPGTES